MVIVSTKPLSERRLRKDGSQDDREKQVWGNKMRKRIAVKKRGRLKVEEGYVAKEHWELVGYGETREKKMRRSRRKKKRMKGKRKRRSNT